MTRQTNGCSTHPLKPSVAKQWIGSNAHMIKYVCTSLVTVVVVNKMSCVTYAFQSMTDQACSLLHGERCDAWWWTM